MSNMRDAPVLKAVADVVKDQIGKAFASLRGRIDEFDGRLKSLETEIIVKALVPPPKGEKGDPGERGEVGPIGPVGPPGNDGIPGIVGGKGDKGEKGDAGVAGIPGQTGSPGIQGEKGLDGAPGKNGEDGVDGKPGADGLQGIQGEKGIDGKSGEKGEKGLDGKDGIQGIAGIKGLDGKDGSDGVDGKDATPVDTKALAAEITEKVLGQIPPPIKGDAGERGQDGAQGATGDKGDPGIAGKDGTPGINGTKGLDGIDGKDGVVGERGEKGLDGKDGRDGLVGPQGPIGKQGPEGMSGRDALDIDILDGIDELASYQRGTYAHHRGGTIKAYRTTDPISGKDFHAAGWQVIQEGIADAGSALSADERTVVTSLELTSGKLLTSKFSIPTLIHKGTWKPEQRYERGDFATMAGSTWHCNELTQDRPGISKAWTLVVKRGSDGKDATVNGAHR